MNILANCGALAAGAPSPSQEERYVWYTKSPYLPFALCTFGTLPHNQQNQLKSMKDMWGGTEAPLCTPAVLPHTVRSSHREAIALPTAARDGMWALSYSPLPGKHCDIWVSNTKLNQVRGTKERMRASNSWSWYPGLGRHVEATLKLGNAFALPGMNESLQSVVCCIAFHSKNA